MKGRKVIMICWHTVIRLFPGHIYAATVLEGVILIRQTLILKKTGMPHFDMCFVSTVDQMTLW